MDIEEPEPRKMGPAPLNLDPLSIEELTDYIAALEAEIARVKVKIETKKSHLAGAASLFRSG